MRFLTEKLGVTGFFIRWFTTSSTNQFQTVSVAMRRMWSHLRHYRRSC